MEGTELKDLQKWIETLSLEEFGEALRYELTQDDSPSFEGDMFLLGEMIRLQTPPPTPIHPRAMGFHPVASSVTSFDGRNEERRIRRDRFLNPRLFQWVEKASTNSRHGGRATSGRRSKTRQSKSFHVIARNCFIPWGERAAVGTTEEQRNADRILILRTRLCLGSNGQIIACTLDYCGLSDKGFLLTALRVASRGNFLCNTDEKNRDSMSIEPSWFNPTQQFFSLPFYLASRFELGLYQSFRGVQKSPLLFVGLENELQQHTIARLVRKCLCVVLQKCLSEAQIPEGTRDELLWSLLETDSSKALSEDSFAQVSVKELSSIRLVDYNTARGKLVKLLVEPFAEEVASFFQSELMSNLDDGSNDSSLAQRKSQKKRKSKRKKKKKSSSVSTIFPVAEENQDDQESDETDFRCVGHVEESSAEPNIESTKKIVMVASIIDDIVEVALTRTTQQANGPLTMLQGQDSHVVINESGDDSFVDSDQNSKQGTTTEKESLNMQHAESSVNSPETKHFLVDLERLVEHQEGSSNIASIGIAWNFDGTFDELENMKGYRPREKSVLADFFLEEPQNPPKASSTAASIGSSSEKGIDRLEPVEDGQDDDHHGSTSEQIESPPVLPDGDDLPPLCDLDSSSKNELSTCKSVAPPRSESPSPPSTPSPQLSPILVSLADLKDMRDKNLPLDLRVNLAADSPKARSFSEMVSGSLPSSPAGGSTKTLAPTWSREDLRIGRFADDHKPRRRKMGRLVTRQTDALLSYRDAVAAPKVTTKAVVNRREDARSDEVSFPPLLRPRPKPFAGGSLDFRRGFVDSCAKSEIAMETRSEDGRARESFSTRKVDDEIKHITTRDISTTVSSVKSRPEQDVNQLVDERNMYQDLCLTLGAEVGKLRNIVSALQGAMNTQAYENPGATNNNPLLDQGQISTFFQGLPKATTTIGAMSDAGIFRPDYDSELSEDGTEVVGSFENSARPARSIHVRRLSSSGTVAASDITSEYNTSNHIHAPPNFRTDILGTGHFHGLHSSRLTHDILNFLNATEQHLSKLDRKKQLASQRLSRLTKALWPRAQVKLYGSHMTGLSLPSSDLDFVICLPAVHKNAIAVAPGDIEGRNAINESSQKVLSRKLKCESWIDPTSIKIIERTAVPVIKLATKDTRSQTLQLDISFDSPDHHGLEAVDLIAAIMNEIPMVRPLTLVLKQFLQDRGLLTAYTGGLSSYCLFLMVTRYLQEQSSSWVDLGSLLMGFLDFYGNHFDPRATGISVGRHQYFARNYNSQQPFLWNSPQRFTSTNPDGHRFSSDRRHSFSEQNGTERGYNSQRRAPNKMNFGTAPISFPLAQVDNRYHDAAAAANYAHAARPYTFDPLFVEDPLSIGNNVGRNAFRIFQVQRAFSDAHRALVASLEWDNDLNEGDSDYPLLKCLLQSEDVVYDLEDHPR